MSIGQALITAVFVCGCFYAERRNWDGWAVVFGISALLVGCHGT